MKGPEPFSADAHRFLDGEPHAELSAEERAAAEGFAASAQAYAWSLVAVDPALDDAVMAAVRRRAQVARPGRWAWLLEPRTIRVRPVYGAALAAAAALVIWLLPRPRATPVAAPAIASAVSDTVFVHFELVAPGARTVAVAGSFNGWRVDRLQMVKGVGGLWSAAVALPIGEYRYQFVVDGKQWIPDPTAHAQVDDGFGGQNSVIVVGSKGLVRS